jgi:hypothetical protein
VSTPVPTPRAPHPLAHGPFLPLQSSSSGSPSPSLPMTSCLPLTRTLCDTGPQTIHGDPSSWPGNRNIDVSGGHSLADHTQ